MSHPMSNDFSLYYDDTDFDTTDFNPSASLYDDDTDFDMTDFNPSASSHEPWQLNIEISHAQNNILSCDCDDDSADLKPSVSGPQISGLDSNSEDLDLDFDGDTDKLNFFPDLKSISITRNDHQPLTSSSAYNIQQICFTTACADITEILRYNDYISIEDSDIISELISSNSENACRIVANVLCENRFISKEFLLEENPQKIILYYWHNLNSLNLNSLN